MTTTRTSGWQLAEGSATAYERFLVTTFMDRWAADLLDTLAVQPGERLLDVGCGTGIVARRAAVLVDPHGTVTAVDLNPAMLAVARAAAGEEGLAVRFEQADAARLPLGDASIDVACCQCVLQFVPDPQAVLAEIHRVLVPGGRLGISTCRPLAHQPGYAALADAVTREIGAEAGAILRSPYALGDAAALRRLVAGAGFAEERVRYAVWPARFASSEALLLGETASSPLGDIVDRLAPDVQQRLVAAVRDALAIHTDDDGVTFPFETVVVTAVRQ